LNFSHVFGLAGNGVTEVGLEVPDKHVHAKQNTTEYEWKTEPKG
jgi:hypothetical protein